MLNAEPYFPMGGYLVDPTLFDESLCELALSVQGTKDLVVLSSNGVIQLAETTRLPEPTNRFVRIAVATLKDEWGIKDISNDDIRKGYQQIRRAIWKDRKIIRPRQILTRIYRPFPENVRVKIKEPPFRGDVVTVLVRNYEVRDPGNGDYEIIAKKPIEPISSSAYMSKLLGARSRVTVVSDSNPLEYDGVRSFGWEFDGYHLTLYVNAPPWKDDPKVVSFIAKRGISPRY